MNLYLLTQQESRGYDTYDAVVVAAETEADAIRTPPDDGWVTSWNDEVGCWEFVFSDGTRERHRTGSWANCLSNIRCTKIGTAEENVKAGIVLARFNAG